MKLDVFVLSKKVLFFLSEIFFNVVVAYAFQCCVHF